MRRKVLVDMDGVCLDLLSALKQNLPDFIPENVDTYDFQGDIGVDRKEVYCMLSRLVLFNAEKPYDGAKDACRRLIEVADAYAYTLVPPNPMIITTRNMQIAELGLLGSASVAKKEVCDGYCAIFEDNVDVLLDFAKRDDKMLLYLVKHRYNRPELYDSSVPYERFICCDSFSDCVDDFIRRVEDGSV